MKTDKLIRTATAVVVVTVAVFAAIVSYSHAYDLGRTHGQAGTAARLLPLSIDGLILAGSLILLHEARAGRPGYWLARLALWLGIGATLGANVAYGAPFGPLGALLSGWPAVSFIISTEALMGLVRRARATSAANLAAENAEVAEAVAAQSAEPAVDLADVGRRAVLAAAESDAHRIRFAITQGCPATVAAVREWLLFYKIDVSEVNAMSVIRRLSGPRAVSSGELETA